MISQHIRHYATCLSLDKRTRIHMQRFKCMTYKSLFFSTYKARSLQRKLKADAKLFSIAITVENWKTRAKQKHASIFELPECIVSFFTISEWRGIYMRVFKQYESTELLVKGTGSCRRDSRTLPNLELQRIKLVLWYFSRICNSHWRLPGFL